MGNIYGYTPKGVVHENENISRRLVLSRVIKQEKKYLPLIVLSFIMALLNVVFSLLVPIKIGNAIDLIIEGITQVDHTFYFILLETAGYAILAALSLYIMNLINNKIVYNTVNDVRKLAFERLIRLPLSYIDSHPKGDILSRLIADTDQFADGLLMGFTQLFTGIVTIIGTLIFMFSMNVAISVIVVLVTPLSLFVSKYIAGHTYDMFKQQSLDRAEETSLVEEMITGEKTLKAYGKEKDFLDKFDEINHRLSYSTLRATFFSSLTNPSTRFVNNIVYFLVACVGAIAVVNKGSALFGSISVGVLTCFLSYANQYMKPFNEISSVITELQNAFVCANRVFEIVDNEQEEPNIDQGMRLPEINGTVSLNNVDFSYSPDKELIKNLNLLITPGMKVAIVGPTGCGKTTLINLLMRFYDVDSGSICIDDNDISGVILSDIRSAYGMVLQDTWLFEGTIADNIRFGRPDATYEDVVAAANEAHAHSFIRRLKDGYNTVLKEDGGMLSAGQKQLLCIARLMLTRPPMLILDEATSSIDTRTEIKIQNAFKKLMNGRTTFIVAHRLSTIVDADLILVMKDGTIVEKGTHEELLKNNGFYAYLYSEA